MGGGREGGHRGLSADARTSSRKGREREIVNEARDLHKLVLLHILKQQHVWSGVKSSDSWRVLIDHMLLIVHPGCTDSWGA